MMEFLQEPVNLRSKKHFAALASLIVFIFLLIAIPLTVISVFKSGEVNKNPKAASTFTLGIDIFSTDSATFSSYLDDLAAVRITNLRVDMPNYDAKDWINQSKARIIQAVARGFKVSWGVSSMDIKITSANWPTFRQAILDAATWAQANGVSEFYIGNEEELHVDGTTMTVDQIQANLKSLATQAQGIFTRGNVSYSTAGAYYANGVSVMAKWHNIGRGDIDMLGWDVYADQGDYHTYLANIMSWWGNDHSYLTEFGINANGLQYYSTDEAAQAAATASMIDGIKAAGITRANFFCYNHPDFGARNAISGGTYRLLWNTLVESQSSGDITPPTVSITSPTAGSNVSGSVNIAASATDNVGVTRVDFFIDGIIVSSNSISPYTVSWDSKTVGNGSHSITTKAYDSAGNVGTSTPVSVNVQNGDTILPTVSITAPTNGSTVSGGVNVTANASDNVGVTKVEFYVDSVLKVTDTTSPYGFGWDTPPVLNGAHSISAKAYDAVGNTASDSVTVTVQNGDTQAPTVPTGLAITTPAYNKVNLTWTASTDNVGVAGYWVIRNGVTIASTANNSYSDTTVQPNTNYTYQIVAYDAAGNYSAPTNPISVTTPSAPDDTPPSAPTNLVASVVSSSQINLSWTASKDNIGVIGYDVYRNSTKITTVTTTSFGDTGLSASTTYSYFVKARNAAGNVSAASNTASAATQAPPSTTGNITGTVYSSAGGVVGGAKISLTVGGSRKTYVTTSLGVYTISNLTTGTYKLSFSARGYTSQSASVTVAANTTVTKNITLVKSHKGKK